MMVEVNEEMASESLTRDDEEYDYTAAYSLRKHTWDMPQRTLSTRPSAQELSASLTALSKCFYIKLSHELFKQPGRQGYKQRVFDRAR